MSTRNRHIPNVLEPYAPPYASKERRAEHAAGLRALADWVEESPFPIPTYALNATSFYAQIEIYSSWIGDKSFVRRPGSAARLIGGHVKKGTAFGIHGNFTLTREFGGGVTMRYSIDREAVCEAVEVTVDEERSVPVDEEAEKRLRERIEALEAELKDLPTEVRTVPVQKTEYKCPDALLPKPETAPVVVDDVVLDGIPDDTIIGEIPF